MHSFTWTEAYDKILFLQNLLKSLENLNSFNGCISYNMKKKMVAAKITYKMIVEAYKKQKLEGLSNLLGKDDNGNIQVTKNKRVLSKLFDFLQDYIK